MNRNPRPSIPPPTSHRVIVFSRLPRPGNTKTRLIPALGPQGAADLQRQMTRRTLATIDQAYFTADCDSEVRYTDGTSQEMAAAFGSNRSYISQGQGDLGQRLHRSLVDAFEAGVGRALCVGSDCPAISPSLLHEAFEQLATHDLVIGPAKDGGYYLIAMNHPQPELFDGIDWGTSAVLAQTLAIAESQKRRVHRLVTLTDVDEPADLAHWRQVQADPKQAPRPWLSVIILTRNEEQTITAAIESARPCPGVQIIVVDGQSTDDTVQKAKAAGVQVISNTPGRGQQLARGVQEATGQVLLFLHADSRLPAGYQHEIRRILHQHHCAAGAFRLAFDSQRPSLKLIAYGTHLRSTWLQLPYGDQAIFLRRSVYDRTGGFQPLESMEDFELVRQLRRLGHVRISPLPVVTSARKYLAKGPWKTVLNHQRIICRWLWFKNVE